jgi:hypothetical protein
MEDTIANRYEQNPMLVLIENYILDAIGMLEPEKAAKLQEIVCRTFGGKDWRKTIREQFGLPGDSATSLKALWKQRQEEAEVKQEELPPELFAQQVADGVVADMGGT